MRVKDIAKILSVSPVTIRRLESKGLITAPERDINGHRRYTQKHVDEIRRVFYAREAAIAPAGATTAPRADKVRELVERLREGRLRARPS